MKVFEFCLPSAATKSLLVKEEKLTQFYSRLHFHNEIQMTWIIKGEGTLIAGNNMHAFGCNEIYWLGANQPHVFKTKPAPDEALLVKTHSIDIFFSMNSHLSSFFSMPEMRLLRQFIEQQQHGFKIPADFVNVVSAKMLLIKDAREIDQFMNFVDLLRLLVSLVSKLEPLTTGSDYSPYTEPGEARLGTIYDYIMKNYKEQITLEQVSKIAYMTPPAFCRYFKKHTHNTLCGFVNQVRINEACKQLVENNESSISGVAYSSGFNSITNFNRVFKSIVKQSPKEYIDSYFRSI